MCYSLIAPMNKESVVYQGFSNLLYQNVLVPICKYLADKGITGITPNELSDYLKMSSSVKPPVEFPSPTIVEKKKPSGGNTCPYVFQRGNRAGTTCGVTCQSGMEFCTVHKVRNQQGGKKTNKSTVPTPMEFSLGHAFSAQQAAPVVFTPEPAGNTSLTKTGVTYVSEGVYCTNNLPVSYAVKSSFQSDEYVVIGKFHPGDKYSIYALEKEDIEYCNRNRILHAEDTIIRDQKEPISVLRQPGVSVHNMAQVGLGQSLPSSIVGPTYTTDVCSIGEPVESDTDST